MKSTISKHEFRDAFRDYGRTDSFSYEGLGALFDWFEQYEEDCGEETELDVIAICCDFSEHESATSAIKDHGYGYMPEGEGDEEREEDALDWLREQTYVIEVPGNGVIIQGF